jgi:hypothetical protein
MLTKSAVSLVALLALTLAAPVALAAPAHGRPAATSTRHSTRRARHRLRVKELKESTKESTETTKEPSSEPTGGSTHERVLAVHRRERVHPSQVGHPAEPEKTPEVAAAVTEPLVFRTDDKPRMKPLSDREREISRSPDKSSPEPSEGEERRVLKRSEAAHAKVEPPKPPCLRDVVEMSRGDEDDKFSLTRCDGSVAPLAVERMSVLVRPESAQKPGEPLGSLAKAKGVELAPGVRRVDPGLLERLQVIADHFRKDGMTPHFSVVSGYRPMSTGSYHATGQALDLRLEGVGNEALVAFCKTLSDTGCGYYPNSSFVHIDVRPPSTGHVTWIDASGPGEAPRYVSSWPPPAEPTVKGVREAQADIVTKLDRELPPLPVDDHPAKVEDPAAELIAPLERDQEDR